MIITKKMLPFLAENRRRNSRSWYAEHKEDYKKIVYEPLSELTMELAATVSQIDSLIVCDPKHTISRIFRDTRFVKDKSYLYRDNVWLAFKRPSVGLETVPAFYIEIMQDRWRFGMGFYNAPPQIMERVRFFISSSPEEFRKITEPLSLLTLDTESYRRRPKGDCPEDLLPWFMAKGIHVGRTETNMEMLWDDEFVKMVKKGFLQAAPLYNFIIELNNKIMSQSEKYIPENRVEFEW